jgi:hypothetical protein
MLVASYTSTARLLSERHRRERRGEEKKSGEARRGELLRDVQCDTTQQCTGLTPTPQ